MSARLRMRLARLEARHAAPDECAAPLHLLIGDGPFVPSDEGRCPRCGGFHVVQIVEVVVAAPGAEMPT